MYLPGCYSMLLLPHRFTICLIDVMLIFVLLGDLIQRFCYNYLTLETGGLGLASTIILALQVNQLTNVLVKTCIRAGTKLLMYVRFPRLVFSCICDTWYKAYSSVPLNRICDPDHWSILFSRLWTMVHLPAFHNLDSATPCWVFY